MALNLSKLMKQKGPPVAAGTGLPPDMASMMGAQGAPPPGAPGLTAPPAPGMGALMAPKRKTSKPKRKGGKGY